MIVGVLTTFAVTAVPANAATGPALVTGAPGSISNSTIQAPPLPGNLRARAAATLCLNAHLANVGWQGWACGTSVQVGTTGQSRAIEALAVSTAGAGGICAQAHVAGLGWLSQVCVADGGTAVVGTTGQSRAIEALGLGSPGSTTCANAHLAGTGWQGARCAGPGAVAIVGTTGQGRQMEALAASVG
jgi:hypothetical protein